MLLCGWLFLLLTVNVSLLSALCEKAQDEIIPMGKHGMTTVEHKMTTTSQEGVLQHPLITLAHGQIK